MCSSLVGCLLFTASFFYLHFSIIAGESLLCWLCIRIRTCIRIRIRIIIIITVVIVCILVCDLTLTACLYTPRCPSLLALRAG